MVKKGSNWDETRGLKILLCRLSQILDFGCTSGFSGLSFPYFLASTTRNALINASFLFNSRSIVTELPLLRNALETLLQPLGGMAAFVKPGDGGTRGPLWGLGGKAPAMG